MDFIVHFSLPLAFSVLIAVVIVIFIFALGKKPKFYPDYNNAIPVIEVIKALEKTCPISSQNKWILFPFDGGCHRCWTQCVKLPLLQNSIHLYGSATVINSSSVNICSLIADVTKWPEWNPFYTSQYLVKSFHDKQLRRDQHMEAEQVVSIIREPDKIQSQSVMYRFHDFAENKVGWLLLWNPKKLEFLYFLVQPIKNKNDTSSCLLTHIMSSESKLYAPSISLVSQRLRNIQDVLNISSICTVPSKFMPSVQSSLEDSSSENKPHAPTSSSQDNYFSLSAIRARKRDIRNTVFILVPFVESIPFTWSRRVEFKLGVKRMDSLPEKKHSLPVNSKDNVSAIKGESLQKYPLRRTSSDIGAKSKAFTGLSKVSDNSDSTKSSSLSKTNEKSQSRENLAKSSKQNSDTSEESETMGQSLSQQKRSSKFYLSASETSVNKLSNDEYSNNSAEYEQNRESDKLQDINENAEEEFLAMDGDPNKEIFSSSVSDFEILENSEFTENRIAGFMTQGNYGAAELQAEVLVASQYLLEMTFGNYLSVDGWMFHSYHKGLCVLTKTTSSQFLTITSFLCQTEIPVAPKDVWRFVKYPQFRFICDESVKSVKVLEKISNSQKLVHAYHEVGGIIRKELIDFCLLQTEREEVNKYYSCFSSVEFDKCPFMNSVTRGTLKPSGWIVEKVEKDPNKSLVTYMMQVLISSPDSLFIQMLSTMVPQSVHNLKNYITAKPM